MEFDKKGLLASGALFFYLLTAFSSFTIWSVWSTVDQLSLSTIGAMGPLFGVWFTLASISAILFVLIPLRTIDNLIIQGIVSILVLYNFIIGIVPIIAILSIAGFEKIIIALMITISPITPLIYQNYLGWMLIKSSSNIETKS